MECRIDVVTIVATTKDNCNPGGDGPAPVQYSREEEKEAPLAREEIGPPRRCQSPGAKASFAARGRIMINNGSGMLHPSTV